MNEKYFTIAPILGSQLCLTGQLLKPAKGGAVTADRLWLGSPPLSRRSLWPKLPHLVSGQLSKVEDRTAESKKRSIGPSQEAEILIRSSNTASRKCSEINPANMESSTHAEVDQQQLALTPLGSKSDQLARRRFADSLRRLVNNAGGAANFLNLLLTEKVAASIATEQASSDFVSGHGACGEALEADEASPVEALQRCSTILSRMPEAQRALQQLYSQTAADCTALSPSAPSLQVEAEQVVWLQFRRVLDSNPTVNLGVRDFVASVRSGECVLFNRDTDEDTIVESLFPDYKYLIVSQGAEQTAQMLPDLFEVRSKTSERINHFHKTAGSDDCKVVEVDGPKVEVRKELRDLEARKLHIVTKDLIDELYEFYREEMLSGVRATTGTAHVPNYDASQE